jgi:hypothetical protein
MPGTLGAPIRPRTFYGMRNRRAILQSYGANLKQHKRLLAHDRGDKRVAQGTDPVIDKITCQA